MRKVSRLLVILGAAAWIISCPGAEWAQFRGPRASGTDSSANLPSSWDVDTGSNMLWRVEIPGLSHASPIVWKDRIYVATATGPGEAELKVGLYGDIEPADDQGPHAWHLLALDRQTGRAVWDITAFEGVPRVKRHPKSTHCNATPATDGRRIVAILGSEGLFCFDMDGRRLWRKDLGPMDAGFYMVPTAQWGFGSSPVIHDGRVIVLCDVQRDSFLSAFDLQDGHEVWRTARHDVPTWGTPAVVETPGRVQIVVNGWHRTAGYEFTTGRELWWMNGGGDIPVPTPVFTGDSIVLTSAHGASRPMRAIRPDAAGDITPGPDGSSPGIAWSHPRQGNYLQTPIAVGRFLWGCLDNGVVTCFEVVSGAIRYSERLPVGQGYTASPVSDGRMLYFTSETGRVYVVPATPTFSILATNTLGETCLATPAIAHGSMFFRTRGHVVAVGSR